MLMLIAKCPLKEIDTHNVYSYQQLVDKEMKTNI